MIAYVITRYPKDFSGFYIVRKSVFNSLTSEFQAVKWACICKNLEEARLGMSVICARFLPDPYDDPVIVETYLE